MSVSVNRSLRNTHATVTFGSTIYTMYQNSGLGFLGFGHEQGVGFLNVPDPDQLTKALDAVR